MDLLCSTERERSALLSFAAGRSFAACLPSLPLTGRASVDEELPPLSDIFADSPLQPPLAGHVVRTRATFLSSTGRLGFGLVHRDRAASDVGKNAARLMLPFVPRAPASCKSLWRHLLDTVDSSPSAGRHPGSCCSAGEQRVGLRHHSAVRA